MKLFCDHEKVIAVHSDLENIPLSAYASATTVITVPDNFELEKFGDKPKKGEVDTRIFYKRPKISLSQAKNEALKSVDESHALILINLTGNATVEERDTWQVKSLAAKAILDGNANEIQTEMITTEAEMSGLKVNELVKIITDKSSAYMRMIGIASGHRTFTRNEIQKVSDFENLSAVLKESELKASKLVSDYLKTING